MLSEFGYGVTRPKMDKSKSQKFHCKKRARERLKIELSEEMYIDIIKSIKQRPSKVKTKFLCRQSNRVHIYEVQMDDKIFDICYDNIRSTIITILDKKDETSIHSYIDIFGNKHTILELLGVLSLKINEKGDVTNLKYERINKLERNGLIFYELPEHDKIFKLENNKLIEVMCNEIY